jgi:hypothetical protein
MEVPKLFKRFRYHLVRQGRLEAAVLFWIRWEDHGNRFRHGKLVIPSDSYGSFLGCTPKSSILDWDFPYKLWD